MFKIFITQEPFWLLQGCKMVTGVKMDCFIKYLENWNPNVKTPGVAWNCGIDSIICLDGLAIFGFLLRQNYWPWLWESGYIWCKYVWSDGDSRAELLGLVIEEQVSNATVHFGFWYCLNYGLLALSYALRGCSSVLSTACIMLFLLLNWKRWYKIYV